MKSSILRRWMRFGIRAALVATAFFALALGWVVNNEKKQKYAEQQIRALGGQTHWNEAGPSWLSKLLGRDIFANVTHVSFTDVPVDTEALVHVHNFHRLEGLIIRRAPDFDGRDLKHTKGLYRLRSIDLYEVPVTNEGLSNLPHESLPALRELRVTGILTDECLPFIKQLGKLDSVGLGGKLSDRALAIVDEQLPTTKIRGLTYEYVPPK